MSAPVPLGVMKSAFESLTREMAVDLRRAAFSSIVREARDFAVALTVIVLLRDRLFGVR